ncbi:hypothetical protein FB45DRAFT_399494 [Roridomyces roridus]|uniref:ORC1/DEAH AAA+ ATPase domain-containing protein n=1 Tax=Roridomyces roridus TaxID=1738132 RepID=A0AAD7C3Q9_9AGAR|nr:hypothetical protein FB45DRAFT_399494 [Roridomyces roridus]
MLSWLSKHRPRRRSKAKSAVAPTVIHQTPSKSVTASNRDSIALVRVSSGVSVSSERPPAFRPRRQDTDATLVDGFDSDSESLFSGPDAKLPLARCYSPDSFDNGSPVKVSRKPNPDDPSLWKKLNQDGPCFGPVPLDCQASVPVHRSKWAKLASGTTHSIENILETIVLVGEASNFPYLKGIAGIVLLVSNSVQATEDNKVECIRLSKMVIELASVVGRQMEDPADADQLAFGLKTLSSAFNRILQALQSSMKRSYTRRFVEYMNERDLLRECEKELQHCLDVFQIRSHIVTSVAIKRKDTADANFEGHVTDALLPVKNLLANASQEIPIAQIPEDLDELIDLPPMPQIFYGREQDVASLVQMFAQTREAHAVLMGQGGSGKSSLALALLHQPKVEEIYGYRRFFANCSASKNSGDIIACLAASMGLPTLEKASGYRETISAYLSSGPALVVFDNIDGAWDPPTTRLEVEDLLTELSNIPSVSLLITLRGTQRPLGPDYTKPYPAPVGPISTSAALDTFLAISDLPPDGEDAPLIDVLLHLVGFLPLPITLLAQQAQYEPLPFLLERYREEGTAMLCDGDVSMESSIEASLYSPRVSECPAALEVLGILARFPEGTLKTEVTALVVGGGRLPGAMVNKCLSVLHKTCLVVIVPGQPERVKVPEMVRTYLERHVLDGSRFKSTEDLSCL